MEQVGMIGVGAMGLALLERLKLAGVAATVYDTYAPALEQAHVLGCHIASSAADVAKESTLIDIVVRTDEDVLHCMTGVPETVRSGNLCFVVGGESHLVLRAGPHLLKMGKQVFHMGPTGTGAVAKLIKNMVSGSETLIVHEAIQIGLAGGIPYPKTLEMMREIGHDSVLNRWQRTFDPSGANPLPKSGRNVMNKDIPLVCTLAKLYGLDTPITEQLGKAAARIVKANESR